MKDWCNDNLKARITIRLLMPVLLAVFFHILCILLAWRLPGSRRKIGINGQNSAQPDKVHGVAGGFRLGDQKAIQLKPSLSRNRMI